MNPLRHHFELPLPFDEFRVWEQRVRSVLMQAGIERACIDVLEYVCTEMLNNVLDHSGATLVNVGFDWSASAVEMTISDNGRGLFFAVRQALQLESDADAALLLLKGKVTTDPARHTGEGLFFSSRACDEFSLRSMGLALSMQRSDARWRHAAPGANVDGTQIHFSVGRAQTPALADIFARFCPHPELRFTRTEVSVFLLVQTDGALVSRSQGKRLVRGLSEFTAVSFDFTGVDAIQQGFADEVFRVWGRSHPQIAISVLGINDAVAGMLRHVGFDA